MEIILSNPESPERLKELVNLAKKNGERLIQDIVEWLFNFYFGQTSFPAEPSKIETRPQLTVPV